jgi:geranylgeranyl pyrophosphate synthase
MSNFHEWLSQKQAFVESLLEKNLPQTSDETHLNEAIKYSVLNGGKRMRSLLILAIAEIVEVPPNAIEKIICAVEFIHAYSLVHDDMPCMDNDDLRRGKLSCHKKFSESTALLVGDYDKNTLDIIDTYSKSIGLMFQIKDDILDKEASQESLGKTPGKDEKDNKATFLSLLGIAKSKELAAKYYEEALTAIRPFGDKAYYLSSMAELIMTRSH